MTSTSAVYPTDPIGAAVRATLDRVGPGLYGVACSGGADSIALAHAAIGVAGAAHVVVLTIDHGLVPGSAQVAASVAAWASGQGAAAVVRAVAVARRASIEAAARDARYAALAELADQLGLAVVLVGHTARDQAETVVMRILRGTGPAGLAGIPARRGRFARPLLALGRDVIDGYVAARALPIWHDPMNDDPAVARVRVRAELMPQLRRENPQIEAALGRLAGSAAEWLEVIDGAAAPLAHLPLACGALAGQPPAIRKRAVAIVLERLGLDYDAVQLEQIDRLITSPSRGHVTLDIPAGQVARDYDLLTVTVGGAVAPAAPAIALSAPAGPYQLRRWRAGDRMRPIRLKGRSKKLSDLYIDLKIPRVLRDAARVLVRTTDGVIVWAEFVGSAHGEGADIVPSPAQMGGGF